jgi:hypothetical protein
MLQIPQDSKLVWFTEMSSAKRHYKDLYTNQPLCTLIKTGLGKRHGYEKTN